MCEHSLIIGGTRGTGKATARLLLEEGHAVSIIARHKIKSVKQPAAARPEYFCVDINDSKKLKAAIDDIMRLNGPVNNVMFFQRYRGGNTRWEQEINTTLTATHETIELVKDRFSQTGQKNIVIVSSVASRFIAREQGLEYHVAKAGLIQMTRYYAVVLGRKNIRVNAISPGIVLKPESEAFYKENSRLTQLFEAITPLKRMGTSDDVAQLAAFLISSKASYITGQDITIDGGLTLQMQASLCADNFISKP